MALRKGSLDLAVVGGHRLADDLKSGESISPRKPSFAEDSSSNTNLQRSKHQRQGSNNPSHLTSIAIILPSTMGYSSTCDLPELAQNDLGTNLVGIQSPATTVYTNSKSTHEHPRPPPQRAATLNVKTLSAASIANSANDLLSNEDYLPTANRVSPFLPSKLKHSRKASLPPIDSSLVAASLNSLAQRLDSEASGSVPTALSNNSKLLSQSNKVLLAPIPSTTTNPSSSQSFRAIQVADPDTLENATSTTTSQSVSPLSPNRRKSHGSVASGASAANLTTQQKFHRVIVDGAASNTADSSRSTRNLKAGDAVQKSRRPSMDDSSSLNPTLSTNAISSTTLKSSLALSTQTLSNSKSPSALPTLGSANDVKSAEAESNRSAREVARKKAMEKNIWRYSAMDDSKRLAFIQHKLKAKEMAERLRSELLRKLKGNDDDDDEITREEVVVEKESRPKTASRIPRFQVEDAENYVNKISVIPDPSQTLHALRTQFVQDFTTLEGRAIKEYENYWDMRVRDVNVIPKHLIKPYTMEETVSGAWKMYTYLREIHQPLFHPALGGVILVITETDWSPTDKIFEMQKLFAKLPKPIFLVMKSLLTHLCRLSVCQKAEPHHFRALSNLFAPLMFRIPSRANSIYQEQLYLTAHPSVLNYSEDSLDAECDSDDISERGGDAEDIASVGFHEFQSYDVASQDELETQSHVADRATTMETKSKAQSSRHLGTHIARSVITSKYSGTRTSKGPQVENLWENASDEAPSVENGEILSATASVPGFKSEPVIRDRTVFMPDWNQLEVPALSPFNKSSPRVKEREEEYEELEFDDWILKQMQEAARTYNQKNLTTLIAEKGQYSDAKEESTSQCDASEDSGKPQEVIDKPKDITNDDTTSSQIATETEEPVNQMRSPVIDMQDGQDEFEFAGIRIEICEVLEADMYIARTVANENPTSDLEMSNLLQVLDTPMDVMLASCAFSIERLPQIVRKTELETVAVVPDNPLNDEPEVYKPFKKVSISELNFGESDPDGFGWNLMTKRGVASELFLVSQCQTALSSALEMIIKNLDVLFDYNMHIEAEKSAKAVVSSRRKSEMQTTIENASNVKVL